MEVINREAKFNYFILEEIECGIVLTGTEIKAIRTGKVNLKDSYAVIRRSRKLLLHKKEILKLNDKINQEGLTLVPLKLYFKKNKVKILLGLCKGKKTYDKRETIKTRDLERETRKLNKYKY